MALQSAVPNSETGTQLHKFARWFHELGISWSGTPAELASELSDIAGKGVDPVFRDSDQLVRWLERNAKSLGEFGVDASVQKSPGLPFKRIFLHRTEPRRQIRATSQANHGCENQPVVNAAPPIPRAPENVRAVQEEASPSIAFKVTEPSKSHLIFLFVVLFLGVCGFIWLTPLLRHNKDLTASTRGLVAPETAASVTHSKVGNITEGTTDSESSEKKKLPLISSALAETNRDGNQLTSNGSGIQLAANTDLRGLIHEARENRLPASQYELGIRYAEGRGVAADRVAAYAWLVLARVNGDQRSEQSLKVLTKQLSPTELQQVRMVLGDAYARGIGVAVDDVVAHSWYSLAEVAGSAEGRIRKQEIESRMTPQQIHDAETRTTAWMSRH
jgi:TPR repeat protein